MSKRLLLLRNLEKYEKYFQTVALKNIFLSMFHRDLFQIALSEELQDL